ncbi:FAD-dependent oxidoreductase [Streptomyces yangpuensis]
MRLDDPPRHLAILGGGYIAAELAEVFAAAGSAVTIVEKEEHLLGPQDATVAERFTELVRSRYDLRLGRELTRVGGRPGALRLTLDDGSTVDGDMLLVAVGRTPNSDRLDLEAGGVATHDDGRVIVDRYQRTSVEGVFALGGHQLAGSPQWSVGRSGSLQGVPGGGVVVGYTRWCLNVMSRHIRRRPGGFYGVATPNVPAAPPEVVHMTSPATAAPSSTGIRRIVAASLIGSTIEWYDNSSGISFCDSSGIELFLRLHQRCRGGGTQLLLCGVPPLLVKSVQVHGVDRGLPLAVT